MNVVRDEKINKKVFVGLSGGVDSAVSAYLLKRYGFDVTGVFIKTWQPDYIKCTWKNDRLDAMRICAHLNIPFLTLDLEKEYKKHVIDYMLNEYKNNNTPNPDIMCNKYIKFDGFLKFAKEHNAVIATGHYAKILPLSNRELSKEDEKGCLNFSLSTPKDKNKDQTYFLYQIKKENLKDILFPLSNLEKSEVRKIAKDNNLFVAEKKESMGICMLGDISMKDFLIKELSPISGDVCNEDGEIIGKHDGVILYTIGERHGFDVIKKMQDKNKESLPYFIYQKDFENNILYVTQDESKVKNLNKKDFENGFVLKNTNLSVEKKDIDENKIYKAMTRYRGKKYDIKLNVSGEANIKITPLSPDFFAVSGQSMVVYDENIVIAGGTY